MIRINQNHKYCDSTGFQKGFVLFISYLVFSVLLCDVYVCRPIYQPILSYMSLDISVSCLLTDYCVVIFRPYSRTKAEFFFGGRGDSRSSLFSGLQIYNLFSTTPPAPKKSNGQCLVIIIKLEMNWISSLWVDNVGKGLSDYNSDLK